MAENRLYMNLVEDIKTAHDLTLSMEPGDARDEMITWWINEGNRVMQTFRNRLTARNLTTGEKSRIQNASALLQAYCEIFLRLSREVIGGNINLNNENLVNHRVQWRDLDSAFNNRIRTGVVINLNHVDLPMFLIDAEAVIADKLENVLRNEHNIKVNVILSCKFEKVTDGGINTEIKHFNTQNVALLPSTDIKNWLANGVSRSLLTQVEDFEHRDSGWSMVEIIELVVCMNRYEPLRGGISTFVMLPEDIRRKNAIVNVVNEDKWCFIWSVLAALYPTINNANRVSNYEKYLSHINISGLKFPMALKDVNKFEKLNNLAINVYGIESETFKNARSEKSIIVPLYLSNNFNSNMKTIHLLMLKTNIGIDMTNNIRNYEPIYHYAYIKNLSRLLSHQVTSYGHTTFFCDRCLCHCSVKHSYENHKQDCVEFNKVRMQFPENNIMQFSNFRYQGIVPFVVYADIECILESSGKHVPHSVGFYKHCSFDEKLCIYNQNRSKSCIEWFIEELRKIAVDAENRIKNIKKMIPLTQYERDRFMRARDCYICEKPFTNEEKKCHDHCHFTGKYRGPAHNKCNLNFKESAVIPIVFHNLSGYDSHFIIKSLASNFSGGISLLPINN